MVHAQFDNTARQALAAKAVDAKIRKDLSWQQIADAAGLSVAFVTAASSASTCCPRPRPRPWPSSWTWTPMTP